MSVNENPTVGALLRARRLELGASVNDAAIRTRIRRAYLLALENDRFDLLPGEVYVTGFLRLYAEDLQLPAEPILSRCREQITASESGREGVEPKSTSLPRSSRHHQRSAWSVWLTSAALVAAALLLAHFNHGERTKPDFFAPRSPGGPPAVLWTLLLQEAESVRVVPPWAIPSGEDSAAGTGEKEPRAAESAGNDDGFTTRRSQRPSVSGRSSGDHRSAGHPRNAETRPVGVVLGWTSDSPHPPPALFAGLEMLSTQPAPSVDEAALAASEAAGGAGNEN